MENLLTLLGTLRPAHSSTRPDNDPEPNFPLFLALLAIHSPETRGGTKESLPLNSPSTAVAQGQF